MKLNKYINTQLILSQNQINKNKKYSNDYIREKTYNSFKQSKNNIFNSFETLKNEESILNGENKLFYKLYMRTKKLYPTKINITFKDLITHYNHNNYKIPDLSDKKNIFNPNPILLEDSGLVNFYRSVNMKKDKLKRKQKHINFIKKEMLMIENIKYNNSNIKFDMRNETSDVYKYKEENNKKRGSNYAPPNNILDKIKEEKRRIKQEKLSKKLIRRRSIDKGRKQIKIEVTNNNFSNKKKEENIVDIIDKLKNQSFSPIIKNDYSQSIDKYNSKDSMAIKNNDSISTDYKHNSLYNIRNNKTNKTIQNIFPNKIKFKLLKEEKNKLLKEIQETESTINNKDLMEKNITIENYTSKYHLSTKKINLAIKKNQDNNKNNDMFGNIFKNMKIYNNFKKRTIRYSKFLSQRIKGPIFLNFFGQKALKNSIMRKLSKENDNKKIIESFMKLDLEMFDHDEIEKLIKIYYEKIMGYKENSVRKIINMELGDELICELINKYIKQSKEKIFKYSSNPKINKSLDKVNKEIHSLKRRYFIGKTHEILG